MERAEGHTPEIVVRSEDVRRGLASLGMELPGDQPVPKKLLDDVASRKIAAHTTPGFTDRRYTPGRSINLATGVVTPGQEPERFDEFTGPMDDAGDTLRDEVEQHEASDRRLCEKLAAKWNVAHVKIDGSNAPPHGVWYVWAYPHVGLPALGRGWPLSAAIADAERAVRAIPSVCKCEACGCVKAVKP